MTYPSNFKLFYENQIRSVPALIYKNADSKMIDVNPNSNDTHWQFSLRPVESWGEIFTARDIYEYFDQLLGHGLKNYYSPMSKLQKLKMIYSHIYKDEKKSMMKYVIDAYEQGINFEVKTKIMKDLKAERYFKSDINKESARLRNELMTNKPLLEYVEKSIKWLEQNQNTTFISRLEPLETLIYLK